MHTIWPVASSNEARTALITGAGSGIGQAFATELSRRCYRVHLLDIDEQATAGLATELGEANPIQGDIADLAVMERAAASIGSVDLLCLNAGVVGSSTGAAWEASTAEWDRVLGVNLFGVVNGLRAFVPLMLERGSPSQIIITASLAGAATWPGGGPYAASKHAVLAVAEQAALELADSKISVTVLCPALVKTAMSDIGEDPHEVAVEALRAVDEQRFAVVPPEWREAVVKRAVDLASGERPVVPSPSA
jgi:NAD(P)-dependent dehydrogenase (short-subunit alcohol dehydrogenase family)